MQEQLKLCTVGIKYLDEQHDILVALLLELQSVLEHKGRTSDLCEMLLKLINFAEVHFYAEELLMESIGFPAVEAHRAEHKKIALRLDRFRFQLNGTDPRRTEELLSLLYTWIEQHVREWDSENGRFFALQRKNLTKETSGDATYLDDVALTRQATSSPS